MENAYQVIREKMQTGSCIMATVVEGIHAGEKMVLSEGQAVWLSEHGEILLPYQEKISQIEKSQMIEVGEERIFCEKIGKPCQMVVCGGGHVAVSVIRIAKITGFQVTVLEDRPKFADWARKAGADEVICDSFAHGIKQISGNQNTYFVIMTRGHRYDTECLKEAVGKPNAYVGMMGSHKRVRAVKEQLEAEGVERELLAQVHMPIGLSIGAETPEEIAVSVMAEIIQVKNGKRKCSGYEEEMFHYLTGKMEAEQRKVLAVIVSKKGSAPREIGTKMLILENGMTVGTIGGGCVESEAISQGLQMMRTDSPKQKMFLADMTGREAEEEGMVCGGRVELYLEIL